MIFPILSKFSLKGKTQYADEKISFPKENSKHFRQFASQSRIKTILACFDNFLKGSAFNSR